MFQLYKHLFVDLVYLWVVLKTKYNLRQYLLTPGHRASTEMSVGYLFSKSKRPSEHSLFVKRKLSLE